MRLLKDADVFAGFVVMESANLPDYAPLVVSFAAGTGGIAAVLRTWFNRHRHRSITFMHKGEQIDIRGMSQADMDSMIDRVLEASADAQREMMPLYEVSAPLADDDDT